MLLMGNKLDEQTPRVHLENFLTMVSSLYNLFFPSFAIFIRKFSDGVIIFGGLEILQGVMHLQVRYVFNLFHYITMSNKILPLYNIDSFSVRNHGFWEHCHVRRGQFLVLGNFIYTILWSYMGTVSYQKCNLVLYFVFLLRNPAIHFAVLQLLGLFYRGFINFVFNLFLSNFIQC